MKTDLDQRLDELFALCQREGTKDYIGEAISQLEHLSQGTELALAAGADDELVLATAFHDLGHICVDATRARSMQGYGVDHHDRLGAAYLKRLGFSARICGLVGNHVRAKRYLVSRDSAYLARLSAASLETLRHQGGAMSPEEAAAFEQDPLFADSLKLRLWDEAAKRVDTPLLDFAKLRDMARHHLEKNRSELQTQPPGPQ
ncbi:MAG: hypothetical protein RL095_2775 [Verrucomicrobiota bacterium]|jgi:predicted HD phosphohydrolase